MKRSLLLAALVVVALVPAFAFAHPPAADPHHSCVVHQYQKASDVPKVPVQSMLSYLAPVGTSLPCPLDIHIFEFGSHAGRCPVSPPTTGTTAGAYCGPLILPGETATCSWSPVNMAFPPETYGLIIGFERPSGALPLSFNGLVRLTGEGEVPVYGPFRPSSVTVPNPYPTEVARVVAYVTNVAQPPDPLAGALSIPDLHEIGCVAS